MSRDVILVESLPQRLCEPFGYIELQGFTDLRSPLRHKENCGTKPKCGHQGKAADVLINGSSSPPQPPPPTSSNERGGLGLELRWSRSSPEERRP